MSSYRPRYDGLPYDDVPPPPPPLPDLPPLPRGPPPSYNAYRRGDSWRPGSPPTHDFSFRNRESAPQYPRSQESSRFQALNSQNGTRRRNYHNDDLNLNRAQKGRYGRGGRAPRPPTCDRPLLKRQHHEIEADLEMLGVTEGAAKYLNADDLDDTSGAEMDQSDSEREEGEVASVGLDDNVDIDTRQPPAKRREIGVRDEDASSHPKWSNPDPYFVLPPVDETLSKRKDPVETIRKYRKATESKPVEVNQVAANDDFISFDTIDGSLGEQGSSVSENDSDEGGGMGVAGAPTGPRQLRPRQNSRPQASREAQNNVYSPPSPHLPDRIVLDIEDGAATNGYGSRDLIDLTADFDNSLGSRKRTHDDQIKGYARGASSRGAAGTGLLEDWRPDHRTNPVPWLKRPDYLTVNGGFRLHKEICDFFDYVRPQRFEEVIREDLIERLRNTVKKTYPNCDVHCFGSFAAGLYLPNADMDVVVTSRSYCNSGEKVLCQNNKNLRKFGDFVKNSGLAKHASVEVIVGAKVPLVKFVDRNTLIRVDMSFENDTGLVAIDTFHDWKRQYPAMPVLVTILKQFLMMRGLNEVQHGGIGGFSVTCLVTSLLQHMPRVQTGKMVPEEHLGEVLIEFLDFYGSRFDVSRTGIRMDPPEYFDKHAYNRSRSNSSVYKPSLSDRLAIMDPNNPDHDISGGSRNVLSIFGQFAKAHRQILTAMKANDRPSLLDWMLGGNYRSFIWQRNHLRDLYKEHYVGAHDVPISKNVSTVEFKGIISTPNDPHEDRHHLDQKQLRKSRQGPTRAEKSRQKRINRAERLRQEYSDMLNIPPEIGTAQANTLEEMYSKTKIASGIGFSDVPRKNGSAPILEATLPAETAAYPRASPVNGAFTPINGPTSTHASSNPMGPLDVANYRSTAGNSPSEPISID